MPNEREKKNTRNIHSEYEIQWKSSIKEFLLQLKHADSVEFTLYIFHLNVSYCVYIVSKTSSATTTKCLQNVTSNHFNLACPCSCPFPSSFYPSFNISRSLACSHTENCVFFPRSRTNKKLFPSALFPSNGLHSYTNSIHYALHMSDT